MKAYDKMTICLAILKVLDKYETDSAERDKGQWIEDGYQNEPCVCSICGVPQDITAKFLFSFCPNCGADMRGKHDELEK